MYASWGYNECPDWDITYLIEVVRDPSAADSCEYYELEIANGIF